MAKAGTFYESSSKGNFRHLILPQQMRANLIFVLKETEQTQALVILTLIPPTINRSFPNMIDTRSQQSQT